MSRESEEKKKALNRWLFDEYALIHVSTGAADLLIPEHLKTSPSVTLKLSKNFQGTLIVEDTHVEAELRFRGVYFTCRVPFSAVWGVESMKGERKMWMASTPPELIAALLAQQVDPTKSAASAGRTPGDEPTLKIVPSEVASAKPAVLSLAKPKSTEKGKPASLRIEKGNDKNEAINEPKEKSADKVQFSIAPLPKEQLADQTFDKNAVHSSADLAAEEDKPLPPRPKGGRPNLKLVK